jgi:hypothetical protein
VVIALLSAGLKEDFTDAVKAAWLWLWDFLTRSMVQVAALAHGGESLRGSVVCMPARLSILSPAQEAPSLSIILPGLPLHHTVTICRHLNRHPAPHHAQPRQINAPPR